VSQIEVSKPNKFVSVQIEQAKSEQSCEQSSEQAKSLLFSIYNFDWDI